MEQQPILLARIAETLCVCDMTDGFCLPRNKPQCRCWKLARAVYRTIGDAPNPVLQEGWKVTDRYWEAKDKADPAKVLEAMLRATPNVLSAPPDAPKNPD